MKTKTRARGSDVKLKILGLLAVGLLAHQAQAVPLRLDYTINDIGLGLFRYDFTLTLDNNDGSWVAGAGQQFDWIVFGDRQGSNVSASGFCPDLSTVYCAAASTYFAGLDAGFFGAGAATNGAHRGPTLGYGGDLTLPGWQPGGIGAFTDWSYTTNIYLPQGQLYWSYVVSSEFGTGQYILARQVPEPGTLALLGLGLAGLGLSRRRKTH